MSKLPKGAKKKVLTAKKKIQQKKMPESTTYHLLTFIHTK